jgi:hypothetical protein
MQFSLFQTELMSLWILVKISVLPESVVPEFDHYLAIYTFLTFQTAISNSKGLGSGTNGSAICISI